MNKLFKRFIAYTIDMMVVFLVVQSLSGIPQINWQLDNYNKYYDSYVNLSNDYIEFKNKLVDSFEDENLSLEEYDYLVDKYPNYKAVLDSYYEDKVLTTSEYNKLNKKITKEYSNNYKKVYYKIEKNSILYFVLYLIFIFIYFVLFNKYTNGQTLGKKLMRLRIVNNNDNNKEIKIWQYIVRTLVIYQSIYYLIRLIAVNIISLNIYYPLVTTVFELQRFLEILAIAMIMLRIDGRGLHDYLAGTKVVLYDRNGNIVLDKLDTVVANKKRRNNTTRREKKRKVVEEPND